VINKIEISDSSAKLGLSLDVIEKDYVLGWIIAAINQDSELKNCWIFKGGTCLKKCFFENYRFSEDLDFTLTNKDHMNTPFLEEKFKAIAEWVYENSGIDLPLENINFKERETIRNTISIKGKVAYHGPIHRLGSLPRIKLDLTTDEALISKPIQSIVYHSYTDFQKDLFYIQSYSYAEIFAEKLRATIERSLPRDLYDVVEIYKRKELLPNSSKVLKILTQKCDFKGVGLPTKDLMRDTDKKTEIRSAWENMLKHQLKDLPSINIYLQEYEDIIYWLHI
jgi:predicted nucleotidyltransferase component of viral defense system